MTDSTPKTLETGRQRICSRCVMDTTDPNITFDDTGICIHCRLWEDAASRLIPPPTQRDAQLAALVERIKQSGNGKEYDSVMGLSGGVDSSYVAYLAHQHGLRPLAVHLDNGWDSELAVQNIHNIVNKLGFDLSTHVIDWDEFRDIQRSFFTASVVDIEMVTDHAITAVIYRLALKHRVRFILSGNNVVSEAVMPSAWTHRKSDLRNLKAIHRKHGTRKIKTFPTMSTLRQQWWQSVRGIQPANLLNYVDYDRNAAIATLERELGWRYYGGKHYESTFTRFYQAHILPEKFGIDKRRAHYSALINAGQLTRDEALASLGRELYNPTELAEHRSYVAKKLGFSDEEFRAYLDEPPRSHFDFRSDEGYVRPLLRLKKAWRERRGQR